MRKFVSLGTIGILLGVSAWLRPLQPAEWLPSRGIRVVSVATPAVRPLSVRGSAAEPVVQNRRLKSRANVQRNVPEPHRAVDLLAASAPLTTTDVPVALRREVRRNEPDVAVAAATGVGDPVADAFVTAGRRTGNAFQAGVTKTGGAFRTAGRAIRSIF